MEQTPAEPPIGTTDPAMRPGPPTAPGRPAVRTRGGASPCEPAPSDVPAEAQGEAQGSTYAERERAVGESAAVRESAAADHGGDEAVRGEHIHNPPGAPPAPHSPAAPAFPAEPSRRSAPLPGARGGEAYGTDGIIVPGGDACGGERTPQRHSVRAQVLAALREALLYGELAPGEVYSAPALGARFGVSATPVREAMQQLVTEGAVETVPNRGFRVAECSDRDQSELAEIRVWLEVPAVLRAARRVPPESWDELRPLADDTLTAAACGDCAAYAETDRAFHTAVLRMGGNEQLVVIAEDVQRRAQRRPMPLAPARRAAELLGEASEHVALLDALRIHDLAAVERLLHGHVTSG